MIHSVLVHQRRLVRGSVPRDRNSGRWDRKVISVPLGVEFRGSEEDLPAWYRECEGLILRELQAAGQDGWEPEHRTDLSFLVDHDRVAGDFPVLVSATISLIRPLAAGDASGLSAAPDLATSDIQDTLSSSTDRVRQLLTEAEQAGWERPEAVEELLARAFAGDPLVESHSTELANLASRLLAAQGRRYLRLLDLSLGLEVARTEEDEDETGSGPHGSLIVGLLALEYGARRSGMAPVWFAPALERSLGASGVLKLFFGRLEPEQTSNVLVMGYRMMRPSSAIDFAQYTAAIPESIPHIVALMLRLGPDDAMEHWFVNRPVSEEAIPYLVDVADELIARLHAGPASEDNPDKLLQTLKQQVRVLLMVMQTVRRLIRELRLDSAHPVVQRFPEMYGEAAAMWNYASGLDDGATVRGLRVVHFPGDRELGTLYIREQPDPSYVTTGLHQATSFKREAEWAHFAEADHSIAVSDQSELGLWVDDGAKDLFPLTRFAPDALQAMRLSESKSTPTDRHLANLRKLTDLRYLDLSGSGITDAGLEHLQVFSALLLLDLARTGLTDKGLRRTTSLSSLQALDVGGTQVTQDGLADLRSLTTLRYLGLANTGMTDDAIPQLAALRTLQTLDLTETSITAEGLAQLRRALPECTVYNDHEPISDWRPIDPKRHELREAPIAPPADVSTGPPPAVTPQVAPPVIKTPGQEEPVGDIYARLLKERIVFVGTPIDDQIATLIIAQRLHLAREDPNRDITMYINTPGGDVNAAMTLYDTMQLVQPDVATCCVGMAAEMGALLLCGGAKHKRFALPNSTIMIRRPVAEFKGSAADPELQAREILRLQQRALEIYSFHTGQEKDRINKDWDSDFRLGAQAAKDYGMIDDIIGIDPGNPEVRS